MNILFFLTPKNEVASIQAESTLRQALEKLETHRYTALPLISKNGEYVGTITEGDLLWYIKDHANLTLFDAEDVPLMSIRRRRDNAPVLARANMEDLFDKVMNQNFVPVTDDENVFIGIVTRKDVMTYLRKENQQI